MLSILTLDSKKLVEIYFTDMPHSFKKALQILKINFAIDKYYHTKRLVKDNTTSYIFRKIK